MKARPIASAVQPERDAAERLRAPIGVADPNCRRLAEAERHHEGHRGDLKHQRMRFERRRADQAHEEN